MNTKIDKTKLSSFIRDLFDGKERNIKGTSYKLENDTLLMKDWRDISGTGETVIPVWVVAPGFAFQTILDFCNPSLGPVGFEKVYSSVDNLFQDL